MNTVDTSQLPEVMTAVNETAKNALSSESLVVFEQLEKHLSEVDGYVRELQQAMWADEADATLKRLECNEPLTPTDKEVIRTFVVSDAERYLAVENNYKDWIQEFKRLVAEMEKKARMVDRNNIGDLRGVLKDAMRVIPDIRNYLDERARVERFDLAVESLDQQTRNMLIRIIREQLLTPAR